MPSITIPSLVTSIGIYAFANDVSLNTVDLSKYDLRGATVEKAYKIKVK